VLGIRDADRLEARRDEVSQRTSTSRYQHSLFLYMTGVAASTSMGSLQTTLTASLFLYRYRPTDTHTPNGPGGAGTWFLISYGALLRHSLLNLLLCAVHITNSSLLDL
jgi:hypothetical protein